jgi:hypothetical protein
MEIKRCEKWSQAEDSALVKLAGMELPLFAISRKIGRSYRATQNRLLHHHGIMLGKPLKKFTPADDEILTRPNLTLEGKAEMIGRSKNDCNGRIHRLRRDGKLSYCRSYEAAAITGLSSRQLSQLCRAGVFIHWRPSPQSLLLDLADLHRVMTERPDIIVRALARRKKRIGKENW